MPNNTDCKISFIGDRINLFNFTVAMNSVIYDRFDGLNYLSRNNKMDGKTKMACYLKEASDYHNRTSSTAPAGDAFPIKAALDGDGFTFKAATPMPSELLAGEPRDFKAISKICCAIFDSKNNDDWRDTWDSITEILGDSPNCKNSPIPGSHEPRETILEFIQNHWPSELLAYETAKTNRTKHGSADWYDWRIANWGTKWDAYDVSIGTASGDELSLSFETAWSPPLPAVADMCSKFSLEAVISYADEGGGFFGVSQFDRTGRTVEEFDLKSRGECKSCKSETLKAVKKNAKKTPRLHAFILKMLAGDQLTEKDKQAMADHFAAQPSGSAERFVLFLAAHGGRSKISARTPESKLLDYMQTMLGKKIISPDTKLNNDCTFADAIFLSGWTGGMDFILTQPDFQKNSSTFIRGLLAAIFNNNHDAAARCLLNLPDDIYDTFWQEDPVSLGRIMLNCPQTVTQLMQTCPPPPEAIQRIWGEASQRISPEDEHRYAQTRQTITAMLENDAISSIHNPQKKPNRKLQKSRSI